MALACVSTGSAQQLNVAKLANPAVDTPSCDALFVAEGDRLPLSRHRRCLSGSRDFQWCAVCALHRRVAAGEPRRLGQDRLQGSARSIARDTDDVTTRAGPASADRRANLPLLRATDRPAAQPVHSEARLVVATEPSAPPEAMAKIVLDEPAATAEQPIEPTRLAEATPPAATAQPNRLPDTAGWTPMLVFAGLLSLVAAIFVGADATLAASRRRVRLNGTSARIDPGRCAHRWIRTGSGYADRGRDRDSRRRPGTGAR